MSVRRQLLLIAAHGSSTDARARDRVASHADQVGRLVPHDATAAGFTKGGPLVQDAVRTLIGAHHEIPMTLTVVPFMTSSGYYAREVLPVLLRDSLAELDADRVRLLVTKPIGASRRVTALLHRRAVRLAARERWGLEDVGVLLVGHGTRRHASSRDSTLTHARALSRFGWGTVAPAFIDDDPGIAEALSSSPHRHVIILPFMIGGASHVTDDIPQLLGLPASALREELDGAVHVDRSGRRIVLDAPLGVDAALADIAASFAIQSWSRATAASAPRRRTRTGTVQIVGAGPGAPDLISVRGARALRRADVVIHDRLVSDALLATVRPGARLIDAGKWPETPQDSQEGINAMLIAEGRRGQRVVRLKGGDPFVFGRGSEEVDACREGGIATDVIPGISSALAAPAAVGIPVTARQISRGFAVVTASIARSTTNSDDATAHLDDYARIDTLVVLMGRKRLAAVCERLVRAGRAADTPVACIERATLPDQRVVRGTLATIASLADEAGIGAPMVTVIGSTAA